MFDVLPYSGGGDVEVDEFDSNSRERSQFSFPAGEITLHQAADGKVDVASGAKSAQSQRAEEHDSSRTSGTKDGRQLRQNVGRPGRCGTILWRWMLESSTQLSHGIFGADGHETILAVRVSVDTK